MVKCSLCGKDTPMDGTKKCDNCWELDQRIKANPEIAIKILESINVVFVIKFKKNNIHIKKWRDHERINRQRI